MELDPTITNDQDDNERPARYLKLSTGIKRRAGKWFRQHVMRRIKGYCVCHVVFIFQHNTPIG
jgi:hypothetical protein